MVEAPDTNTSWNVEIPVLYTLPVTVPVISPEKPPLEVVTPVILAFPRTVKAFHGLVVPIPILERVLIPVATANHFPARSASNVVPSPKYS